MCPTESLAMLLKNAIGSESAIETAKDAILQMTTNNNRARGGRRDA